MRILVLDDEPARHELFRAAWHDITSVWSAEEALAALAGDRFDIVSLDYDLGPCPCTGLDVARHIIEMPVERRPVNVFVHTGNDRAAEEMIGTLHRAGIAASRIDPLRLVTRR